MIGGWYRRPSGFFVPRLQFAPAHTCCGTPGPPPPNVCTNACSDRPDQFSVRFEGWHNGNCDQCGEFNTTSYVLDLLRPKTGYCIYVYDFPDESPCRNWDIVLEIWGEGDPLSQANARLDVGFKFQDGMGPWNPNRMSFWRLWYETEDCSAWNDVKIPFYGAFTSLCNGDVGTAAYATAL